jgi:hypothetical protein
MRHLRTPPHFGTGAVSRHSIPNLFRGDESGQEDPCTTPQAEAGRPCATSRNSGLRGPTEGGTCSPTVHVGAVNRSSVMATRLDPEHSRGDHAPGMAWAPLAADRTFVPARGLDASERFIEWDIAAPRRRTTGAQIELLVGSAPGPRAAALVSVALYSPASTAAFSRSSEVAQRFLTSREAIGAASLPRPLNTTLSSTRREVPSGSGLRL